MGNRTRLAIVALLGGLAVLGLALGAESQEEVFLEPDPEEQEAALSQGAAGNVVVLTAAITALAGAVAVALLSRRPWAARLRLTAGLFFGLYAVVFLGQSASPNYIVIPELLFAELYTSLSAPNFPGTPSVLVPVMALVLAAIAGSLTLARRMLGSTSRDDTPRGLLLQQVSAVLLATPFLAIAAWGNLRLLLAIPHDQPGLGPYLVVLPLLALACLALVGLGLAKAWRLGSFVQNGRLAGAVQESWQALSRAELAAAATLGVLAAIATVLSATDLPELTLRRTFGVTLRAHSQFLLLLAIPLLPSHLAQRRVQRALETAPLHRATLESGTDPLARSTVLVVASSTLLAALATWFIDGALWCWLLALLPVAVLAALRLDSVASAAPVLLLSFVLWAVGNTVWASYNGTSASSLQFHDPPGLLALWRTLGAAVGALAAARLALRLGKGERGGTAMPLAIGAGASMATVALLEMPLTAWLITNGNQAAVAVGSVVASQEPAIRILLHSVAGLLGVMAAILVARLHRPDWFHAPPPPPLSAPMRAKGARPPRPTAKSADRPAGGPAA
ncbi:MAG: hypothetical protein ACYC2H_11430 [Thermoplasmatota archaeon]